ncbi:MAG: glycan-binding surface protein [Bacteroidales bacterium]|nr:glycan-binding surface protein [Bacteroidales bacterium]
MINKFNKNVGFALMFLLGIMLSSAFVACEDDSTDVSADPVVRYIRTPKMSAADSMLFSVELGQCIAIIGENLDNVVAMKFNDQDVVLNSCFITANSIIVTTPRGVPKEQTDKFYLTAKNGNVIEYAITTKMPVPLIENVSKGYLKAGEKITLTGNYFMEDENQKLTVILPGGIEVAPEEGYTETELTFTVPEGIVSNGALRVLGCYGRGAFPYEVIAYNKLQSSDVEGLLFDFDGKNGAMQAGIGWRPGWDWLKEPPVALSGSALLFDNKKYDTPDGEIKWLEDGMCLNYWPTEDENILTKIEPDAPANYAYQFEMLVPSKNPWKCLAFSLIPTSLKTVATGKENNQYYTTAAAYLYEPYLKTPDFTTNDEWITVTCPLAKFTTTVQGKAADAPKVTDLAGLTILWNYGTAVDLPSFTPIMYIDNIRLVKAKY